MHRPVQRKYATKVAYKETYGKLDAMLQGGINN